MQKELRILMLEDSAEEAEKVQLILRNSQFLFTTVRTSCGNELPHYLDTFRPDIVLADQSPTIDALDALEVCQQKSPDVVFIIVTDAVSEEFAVTALRKGAFD